MTELADVQDLGSCAARRVGSTPTTRTIGVSFWILRFFISKIIGCRTTKLLQVNASFRRQNSLCERRMKARRLFLTI